MRAGRLNTKIIIESVARSVDSVGDTTDIWSTYATVWAEVRPQSGNEFFKAREVNSELTHVITMRWIDGITTKMRINNGGAYYDILSVFDPTTRKREMRLYCREQL